MKLQVGVKVLLQNEAGEFLLLKRANKMADGKIYWDIPGGRINDDEPLIEALKREVKEETGLTLDREPTLLAAQDIFANTVDLHVVRLTYKGVIGGNVMLSDEHHDHKWLSRQQLFSNDGIDPYLRRILEEDYGRI